MTNKIWIMSRIANPRLFKVRLHEVKLGYTKLAYVRKHQVSETLN